MAFIHNLARTGINCGEKHVFSNLLIRHLANIQIFSCLDDLLNYGGVRPSIKGTEGFKNKKGLFDGADMNRMKA